MPAGKLSSQSAIAFLVGGATGEFLSNYSFVNVIKNA
jgi:hypothetical protein